MTKRILALVLVCILAIPILVVPASATTTDNSEAYLERLVEYFTEKANTGTGMTPEWLRDFSSTMGTYFNRLQTAVTEAINDFNTDFDQFVLGLGNLLNSIEANLLERLDSIKTGIVDIYQAITTTLFSFLNEISLRVGNILTEVGSIGDKLNEIINGDETQQEEADDFQNQIATENTEMEEAVDQIEQATIPDYEGIDTDFNDILSFGSVQLRFINAIKAIFQSELLKTVFVLAFTLALLSYCFFGKR